MVKLTPLLAPLAGLVMPAAGMTCGYVKQHFKTFDCCGNPDKVLPKTPGAAACPYSFVKPSCDTAEPQTPRDLSTGAVGDKTPKQATLNVDQVDQLPLVNVHYHLGAEHKSDEYNDATASDLYDAQHSTTAGRRLAADPRPGFMCTVDDLSTAEKASYSFQHCKGDVEVGKSYEVHYVHSSAGYTSDEIRLVSGDAIDDGLGGAANGRGILNPMIAVQGQIFQIVQGAQDIADMLHGWANTNHTNSVMYPGSTTGTSHDNEVCSPYFISWHVDKSCHRVSPESFDALCQQMKSTYNLEADLYPHGSRKLVDQKYVVKSEYVLDLA